MGLGAQQHPPARQRIAQRIVQQIIQYTRNLVRINSHSRQTCGASKLQVNAALRCLRQMCTNGALQQHLRVNRDERERHTTAFSERQQAQIFDQAVQALRLFMQNRKSFGCGWQ